MNDLPWWLPGGAGPYVWAALVAGVVAVLYDLSLLRRKEREALAAVAAAAEERADHAAQ